MRNRTEKTNEQGEIELSEGVESGQERKMSKKRKLFNWIAGGLLLLHAGTQSAQWINDYVHQRNQSPQRQAFQEQFGFPILGWKEDIEEAGKVLSVISEELYKEQLERPFRLDSLRISSGNYFKKGFLEQINYLVRKEHLGLTQIINFGPTIKRKITLGKEGSSSEPLLIDSISGLLCHEIKHIRTSEALERFPTLLEEWKSITPWVYDSRISKTKEDNIHEKELECLGLTSEARKNPLEDIAEICERAETNYTSFFKLLYGESKMLHGNPSGIKPNPIITKKIRLAEKVGLIPHEFTEFIGIYKDFAEFFIIVNSSNFGEDTKKRELSSIIERTQNFFKTYPNTVYESNLQERIATAMYLTLTYSGQRELSSDDLYQSINEYKRALNTKLKNRDAYRMILFRLKDCYNSIGEDNKAELMDKAILEYENRFLAGDPLLSIRGVNDILIREGLLETPKIESALQR